MAYVITYTARHKMRSGSYHGMEVVMDLIVYSCNKTVLLWIAVLGVTVIASTGKASETDEKREHVHIHMREVDVPLPQYREIMLGMLVKHLLKEQAKVVLEYHRPCVPWLACSITDIPQNSDLAVLLRPVQEKGIRAIDFEVEERDKKERAVQRIEVLSTLPERMSSQSEAFLTPLIPAFDWVAYPEESTWVPSVGAMPWLSLWSFRRRGSKIIATRQNDQINEKTVWEVSSQYKNLPIFAEVYIALRAVDSTKAYLFIYERKPYPEQEGHEESYGHSAGRRIITETDITGDSYIPWVRAITSTFDIIAEKSNMMQQKLQLTYLKYEARLMGRVITTEFKVQPIRHVVLYRRDSEEGASSEILHTYTGFLPESHAARDYQALYDSGYMIYCPLPSAIDHIVRQGSTSSYQSEGRGKAYVYYIKDDPFVLEQLATRVPVTRSWREATTVAVGKRK